MDCFQLPIGSDPLPVDAYFVSKKLSGKTLSDQAK